jgi:hypothetical protein
VVTLAEGLITVCAFFDVWTSVLTLAVGFTCVCAFFDVCTTVLTLAVGTIKVCDFLVCTVVCTLALGLTDEDIKAIGFFGGFLLCLGGMNLLLLPTFLFLLAP